MEQFPPLFRNSTVLRVKKEEVLRIFKEVQGTQTEGTLCAWRLFIFNEIWYSARARQREVIVTFTCDYEIECKLMEELVERGFVVWSTFPETNNLARYYTGNDASPLHTYIIALNEKFEP